MGALCDPVYDLTVTCPHCGCREHITKDNFAELLDSMEWIEQHMCENHYVNEDGDDDA